MPWPLGEVYTRPDSVTLRVIAMGDLLPSIPFFTTTSGENWRYFVAGYLALHELQTHHSRCDEYAIIRDDSYKPLDIDKEPVW